MIKFFRKIRQELLAEGNMGKYFKYAIGEIILVVIGILIALSINNWNISFQNEEKEILYLTRLTTNLGRDVDLFEAVIREDSLHLASLLDIENNLTTTLDTITDPLNGFQFLKKTFLFTANRTVIDNLISSGQIELLRSNNLVENIMQYYRNTDRLRIGVDGAIQENNREVTRNLILPFENAKITDSDYLNRLRNSIKYRMRLIEAQMKRYKKNQADAETLIGFINQEIENIETIY
ncbi:hypothetical protein SAMN04490243_0465 [Robiginitalea myxolifaciens]|uniref:Uncharacterized protein n=1 Tax=Robiginitalea myxolifaciens TaxID=400055 RepID=A0A1I6FR92_9FLAO|nr:DUF6090 family protein [Robiginitalea myxolifaciens]SFR32317.1 hypothetical protein SAMN04490243_0465 [Robiginitalea myxolifaciens]